MLGNAYYLALSNRNYARSFPTLAQSSGRLWCDDDRDAAVLRRSFGGAVVGDGIAFTHTTGFDTGAQNAYAGQQIGHCGGAA